MKKTIKRYAFTLAEVLITLGIIGVVASITIPTLIQNATKEQYVTKTKKVYSILTQAVKLAEIDNGPYSTWAYGTVSSNGTEADTFAQTYLVPYMNVSKYCGNATGCWPFGKRFDGTSAPYSDENRYAKFILNDGTAIHIATFTNGTTIHFDINGLDGPNIYGKDVLVYYIVPNYSLGIGPYKDWSRSSLVSGSANSCNKTAAQPDACLTLIVTDGWQIKDDYPW